MLERVDDNRLDGRERRKRATRAALRAATLDLGLERGLGDVRIEEIAERAGVSPRTFFNYFDTKEDAALLDVLTLRDDELATLSGPPDALWPQLAALFAADVERSADAGPNLPRLMELQARHPVLQSRQMAEFSRFEGRLAAAIAACLPPDDAGRMRVGVMSGSCITAVRVGLQEWARTGWQASPRGPVEAAFALLAPAFTAGTDR
jgi:AcrR family transcriptional regulator